MAIGLLALSIGRTAEIIVIAVFIALTMYAVSMGAFFRLRRKEPLLDRRFRTAMAAGVAWFRVSVCPGLAR